MPVSLSPRLEATVDQLVATGHYASVEDVMDEALRLLQEREHQRDHLRAQIRVGLDELDRGEGVELTSDLWDDIDHEADEAFRQGEKPDLDRRD